MGEIAEMMLDGTLDAETGEYLGAAIGFPRSMEKSSPYFNWGKPCASSSKISLNENYWNIRVYLRQSYYSGGSEEKRRHQEVMHQFCHHKKGRNVKIGTVQVQANFIELHFKEFKEFIRKKKKP